MEENVILLQLTRASALRIIRKLAKDSSRVIITNHARDRMQERDISDIQIFRCLLHGEIKEGPYRDSRGSWKMKIESISAGDVIRAAIALDYDENGNYIAILTTF